MYVYCPGQQQTSRLIGTPYTIRRHSSCTYACHVMSWWCLRYITDTQVHTFAMTCLLHVVILELSRHLQESISVDAQRITQSDEDRLAWIDSWKWRQVPNQCSAEVQATMIVFIFCYCHFPGVCHGMWSRCTNMLFWYELHDYTGMWCYSEYYKVTVWWPCWVASHIVGICSSFLVGTCELLCETFEFSMLHATS